MFFFGNSHIFWLEIPHVFFGNVPMGKSRWWFSGHGWILEDSTACLTLAKEALKEISGTTEVDDEAWYCRVLKRAGVQGEGVTEEP